MYLVKLVGISILLYVLIVFFSLLSEITYKKRKPREVFLGIKAVMFKSLLYLLVLMIASYIYYVVLGRT